MQYCYHCMETIGTARICPHCGFRLDDYQIKPHHLCPGTLLRGNHYPIGKVLGEGGFGITYVGKNPLSDRKVAIKEFYMNGYVMRDHTVSNDLKSSGDAETIFRNNRDKFLQEARRLAKFEDESGIVGVRDFFNENNTAYIVMDFIEGVTLRDYVQKNGPLSAKRILEILEPVFYSLTTVHEHGLIHRDISPDNIMLTNDGQVKLLDFGAAREVAPNDIKSLSIILKPGYAPEEQYRSKGTQGPWTDVYALCATIYRCITGVVPDDALERMRHDSLVSPAKLGCDCPAEISDALMKGLSVLQENRYQSIPELWNALHPQPAPQPVPETPEALTGTVVAEEPDGTILAESIAEPAKQPEQTPEELFQIGNQYYFGSNNVEQDYIKAVEWYQKAADQGWADAQFYLGCCYESGNGVPKDLVKAAEWYQKAADQGCADAQFKLGRCYEYGKGVPQDHKKAMEWFQKAANDGNTDALRRLTSVRRRPVLETPVPNNPTPQEVSYGPYEHYLSGNRYRDRYQSGNGSPQDLEKAISHYQQASDQGHAKAKEALPDVQHRLAVCYENGEGVEQDLAKAAAWHQKAAEQGHARSQYKLGVCYSFGRGVPEDKEKALEWYKKSADQGFSRAKEEIKHLKRAAFWKKFF